MRSLLWNPPVDCTAQETALLAYLTRTRKLFGFLRRHRHELFDAPFQQQLIGIELAAQLAAFDECIRHVDFERGPHGWRAVKTDLEPLPDEWEQDYRAMVEALRDYVGKSGIAKVLLGLSGGIDSALVAAIAADALGPDNVRCVMLPSEFTSQESLDLATAAAQALGCRYDSVPISGAQGAVGAPQASTVVLRR